MENFKLTIFSRYQCERMTECERDSSVTLSMEREREREREIAQGVETS